MYKKIHFIMWVLILIPVLTGFSQNKKNCESREKIIEILADVTNLEKSVVTEKLSIKGATYFSVAEEQGKLEEFKKEFIEFKKSQMKKSDKKALEEMEKRVNGYKGQKGECDDCDDCEKGKNKKFRNFFKQKKIEENSKK